MNKAGRKKTHGMSYTAEYDAYHSMKARCYLPSSIRYESYGGRGITVCDRWLESFENFYEDMGDRPIGMTLDRKDNDLGYSKVNCRWATDNEQRNNKSNSVYLEAYGVSITIAEWSRVLEVPFNRLHARRRMGWSDNDILFTLKLRNGYKNDRSKKIL